MIEILTDNVAQVQDRITPHLIKMWEDAKSCRTENGIDEELLMCLRTRRDKYSEDEEARIRAQGEEPLFDNDTAVKCNAAKAWITDLVMGSTSERTFTIKETDIPELPLPVLQQLEEATRQKIMSEMQATGLEPEQVPSQAEAVFEEEMMKAVPEKLKAMKDEAATRAKKLEDVISDQFEEGGYYRTLELFIHDFVWYPRAFVKGPVMRMMNRPVWQVRDGVTVAVPEKKVYYAFEHVSPFDVFPLRRSLAEDDGVFQAVKLYRTELQDMIGLPHYNEDSINKVLDIMDPPPPQPDSHTYEQSSLERRDVGHGSRYRDQFDCVYYYGYLPGHMLNEWWSLSGMEPIAESRREYACEVLFCPEANVIIKAIISPNPYGLCPISGASYQEITGSFWGTSPCKMMRTEQRLINVIARSLAVNIPLTSGPQIICDDIDRIPAGEKLDSIYPRKIWQFSAVPGSNRTPIQFVDVPIQLERLTNTRVTLSRRADEKTGIPPYQYGGETGAPGRTFRGLSALMGASERGLRDAIKNIDTMQKRVVQQAWLMNMVFNDDESIKGDITVVSRGALGVLIREEISMRQLEFFTRIAQVPAALERIGKDGLDYLIAKLAEMMSLDPERLIVNTEPDPQAQQQMQLEMQNQESQVELNRLKVEVEKTRLEIEKARMESESADRTDKKKKDQEKEMKKAYGNV